jgi:PAS domain S-box-containing protein
VHRNGVILYINPPATEVMGKTYDELINKQMTDFIVPEYRPLVAQAISRRMEGKNIEPYEIEILTTSGGRRTVAVRGSLIEFAGSPASLNVLTDITDNKQAEAALKKSEDLLKRTGEIARVGGWELDAETHAVTWTEETYHIHEVPVGQMPPLEEAINFFHPDDRRKLSGAIRRALTTGEGYDMELRIITATGKQLWTRTVCQPQVVGGKTIRLIGTFQDITERKAAEEAMSTFGEDLERKVTERTSDISDVNLNLMTEIEIRLDAEKHLTKTVGEKELLLREVHHRVKNNLQIIISLLNLQSRYIEDETTLSAFRESQNRIKAMALVHEKLYQSPDISKIDLDNYIRFLGNSLFQFFGMKGKGITLTMDIRDIFLSIDTAIPLGLMINELISNSLKYAFPGGRDGDISVTVQRQDHTLTILFKDNGAGIPQDFDWRNARSLGLRLVISLVEQLSGTIELDRSAGTAFTIVVKEKECIT